MTTHDTPGRLTSLPIARIHRYLRRLTGSHRVWLAIALLLCALAPPLALVHYVYFDRTNLPDLEPFVRFELPTTGEVQDARGGMLIEMAREYRRVITFDQVPPILRLAILAAEDKDFFEHSGVDYGALPRVLQKTLVHSFASVRRDSEPRLQLVQGGSTLTQQLVRGYFLQDLTRRENGGILCSDALPARLLAGVVGIPATNKLLRKLEEMRLSLWLEDEMKSRFGSREQAKREIFARYASFIYLGGGRYGFEAGSEYYFGESLSRYSFQDASRAAMLAAISKSPRDYAPEVPGARPLRRRNQILALMQRNGSIPEWLMTRSQAEPVRLVAHPRKTLAPAAVDNVFAEIKQHGAGRFTIEDLLHGRIAVRATVDERVQAIVNQALENGLLAYEKRHPESKGRIQGSVVVLRNADAAILAESGGRAVYQDRHTRYCDLNRATGSLRQPGSAMKPLVYLAAFRSGLTLDSIAPDEPIAVPMGAGRGLKWIANYDHQFKGPIPLRQALAESRNAVAIWITRTVGLSKVLKTAEEMGIHTRLQPYITTSLGASEVRLVELANAYRAMASGILAEAHVIDAVTASGGAVLYRPTMPKPEVSSAAFLQIQEGLRGVIRLPGGTAHSLDSPDFPIPVMGKTGTTSDFRDALFVGSSYGREGITVAVRIGFDDNRELGEKETGGRAALPVFREVMLRLYAEPWMGPVPRFPRSIEEAIDSYLATPLPSEPDLPGLAPDSLVASAPGEAAPSGSGVQPALETVAVEAAVASSAAQHDLVRIQPAAASAPGLLSAPASKPTADSQDRRNR